jgi:uncharacterized membrane protein
MMTKGRLEAFSDGVIAIIVTIMVLELQMPKGADWQALSAILPVLETYVFSFVMVWIYWNNHHHLFQPVKNVNGKVLLANGHLLFWLSLMPFCTAWLGNYFEALPVACMGFVLLMAGVAYFILSKTLVKIHGHDSTIGRAVGRDRKGIFSLVFYSIGIILAFFNPVISCICYVSVAVVWLIPDKRIEGVIEGE